MFNTSNLSLSILDTFKINSSGIFLKEFHIQRTFNAFQRLGKNPELQIIISAYEEIERFKSFTFDHLVRLVFDSNDNSYTFEVQKLTPLTEPIKLEVIPHVRQLSGLGLQNYKWESRPYWNKILKLMSANATDVLSLNEKDELVETSRFNLFLYDKNENLVFTPPLFSGCIQGTFREWLLQSGTMTLPQLGKKNVLEKSVYYSDLSQVQIFAANSVRGVLSCELLA